MRVLALLPCVCWAIVADARTWTDVTGQHKVEAELVEVADGVVKLKRADGRVVSLPLAKLSQADQDFLAQQTADGEKPWQVGDKLYIQVRGQWQLATLSEIADGPGSARYVINLQTGDRRSMRVTEKRMRRYGKAGEQDVLLPGDVVEYKSGGKWVTAEVISHDGRWAKIRVEGALGERSTPLTYLRAPGSGAPNATVGSTRVARSNKSSEPAAKEAGDLGIEYPDPPELKPVSFAGVKLVSASGGSRSFSPAAEESRPTPSSLRPLPLSLTPQRNTWDKVISLSVAERGARAAVLRTAWGDDEQMLELIDLTSQSKFLLAGLPATTEKVYLSPDGGKLLSRRTKPYGLDLWSIDEQGLSHVVSWNPKKKADDYWEKLTAVRWIDDQSLLTSTKEATVLWDAATATPKYMTAGGGSPTFIAGGRYFVQLGTKPGGIRVFETATGATAAVVGQGQTLSGTLAISPAGKLAIISDSEGLAEYWDLERGVKLLRTLRPPGANSTCKWTTQEHLVKFGDSTLDLRTMQPSEAPAAQQSQGVRAAGRVWSTNGMALSATPVAAQFSEDTPSFTPALEGPYVLEPGGSIGLEVQVEPSIQNGVRQRVLDSIVEQGFQHNDNSRVRLVASTSLGEPAEQTYRSLFGRGDDSETTVSYQPKICTLKLLVDGQERWSRTSYVGAPMSLSNREGKSIHQLVQEHLEWKPSMAPLPSLPEYILDPAR